MTVLSIFACRVARKLSDKARIKSLPYVIFKLKIMRLKYSRRLLFSFDSFTATTTYTGYCGLYDTVKIEKWGDATEGSIITDWFEGRMIL